MFLLRNFQISGTLFHKNFLRGEIIFLRREMMFGPGKIAVFVIYLIQK